MGPGAFNAVVHKTVAADVTKVNTAIPTGFNNIRIVNASAGVLFWRADRVATDATSADCAMLAGSVEVFQIPVDATNVSIILIAGTAAHSVYFDLGYGI